MSDKITAFVAAKINQARLVSERLTTPPSRMAREQQQIQLAVETGSQFTVGLDDQVKPTGFLIEIEFKVILLHPETKKHFVDYEAKHAAQFDVLDSIGFTDWTQLPSSTFLTYFSFVHQLAIARAEASLFALGIRGVALPRPERFDGEKQLAGPSVEPSTDVK